MVRDRKIWTAVRNNQIGGFVTEMSDNMRVNMCVSPSNTTNCHTVTLWPQPGIKQGWLDLEEVHWEPADHLPSDIILHIIILYFFYTQTNISNTWLVYDCQNMLLLTFLCQVYKIEVKYQLTRKILKEMWTLHDLKIK